MQLNRQKRKNIRKTKQKFNHTHKTKTNLIIFRLQNAYNENIFMFRIYGGIVDLKDKI